MIEPGAPPRPPHEPPVSAPAAGAPARVATPPQPTLEAQLLRLRLVTPDQMSEAIRLRAETGAPVAETVVERGWIGEGDLRRVVESLEAPPTTDAPAETPAPAPLAPPPPLSPTPVAAVGPAAAPAPAAAPVSVLIRLHGGDELEAGAFPTVELARARAKELLAELQDEDSWPFVGGRPVDVGSVAKLYLARRTA